MNKEYLLRFVLDNAVKYDGKADVGSVINRILASNHELKKEIKDTMSKIKELVEEVNSWNLTKQKERLSKLGEIKKIEKSKRDTLSELKNTEKVVVRFAPNPNGSLSLGHCRTAVWNWFIAKKYNGKYILRFDDTDPKIKIPLKESYEWFKEDLEWLGIHPSRVLIQSKRLKKYYKYAQELINKNKAYVCTCESGKKREMLHKKVQCPCYDKYQTDRWKDMFDKYKEGEAILRIKTDINHPNPAIRDWAAFRIVDESKHPLNKNSKVWPLLNFASAIDDYEFKVSHILRGIDLKISDERQKYIYDYFGWTYPETLYHGKLLVSGIKSTSEAKKLIDSGELLGWDDPRLGTIKSLRRRGFQKGAIIKFLKETGIKKSDINVSMDTLAFFNREIIDKKSKRYFFVENPKKIRINDAVELEASIPSHPNDSTMGQRVLRTYKNFYVSDEIDPNLNYRFMHLFNFKGKKFISENLDPKLKAKIIHWLPVSSELIEIEILMNDGSIKKGVGEPDLKKVKVGEIIQFERNFFVKLEKKENKYKFVFCHK